MVVEQWGTYPPPIGGISIHIFRLFNHLKKVRKIKVRDFNGIEIHNDPDVVKINMPFFEFVKLFFCQKKIIHVHTSQTIALVLFMLLGYKHNYIMTIHGYRVFNSTGKLRNYVLTRFLSKAQYIFMNDNGLSDLYIKKFRIEENKIIVVPAYIKPLDIERKELPEEIISFRNKIPFLISANAFKLYKIDGIDVYGLDILIDLIKELRVLKYEVGLVFCLPQQGDVFYERECKKKIEDLGLTEYILIFNRPLTNGFQVWELSDLFIRPTSTDIEGISVKEALEFGTPAIASDVCRRPREAIIFKNRDFNDLLQQTRKLIDNYELPKFSIPKDENTLEIINGIYTKIEENSNK